MAPASKNTAAVILCRQNGELIEVLYDALGLPAGKRLDALVAAFDRRKTKRFLEAAEGKKATLDCKLNVVTAGGTVPLFFSAASSGSAIVVVATREQFEVGQPVPTLPPGGAGNVRRMQVAVRKLEARKRELATSPEALRKRRQMARGQAGTAQLLRLIAHDLTNPISGILAASQFLLEDAGQLLDLHQVTLLKSIESSSEFALQFIEDMLELHLIQSSMPRLRLQPTDVVRFAAECTENCRRRAEFRHIALTSESIGMPPVVDLDRQRAARAITALIRNELESLEQGSTVHVAVSARKDGAEITINGESSRPASGSVKAILEGIRGGSPSKGGLNEVRTALTVSAVSRVFDAHRGGVRMEDRQTGGPTFRIRLPASAQPARASCVSKRIVRSRSPLS